MNKNEIKIGYINKEPTFVKIEETPEYFSITGRIRYHTFGQISIEIEKAIKYGEFESLIPPNKIEKLMEFWKKYHLNTTKPTGTDLTWIQLFKKEYEGKYHVRNRKNIDRNKR